MSRFDRSSLTRVRRAARVASIVSAALLAAPRLTHAATATENFDAAPLLWVGMGNGTLGGAGIGGQYGFSNTNNTAGISGPGEAGGIFFRTSSRSYYADTHLGFLTESQSWSASGEIFVSAPNADNDVLVGHFRTPPEMIGTNELHHAGFILRELDANNFRFMARIRGDGGNQDDGNVVVVPNGAYNFDYSFSGNTLTARLLQQGTNNVVAQSTVTMNNSTIFRANAFGLSGGFSGDGVAQMTVFIDRVSYSTYVPGQRVVQTFDSAPADWVQLGGASYGFSNTNNTGPLSPAGEAGGVFPREDVRRAYADTTIGQLTQANAFGAAGEFFFGNPNNPDTEMFIAHFAQDQVDGIKLGDSTAPDQGGHNIAGIYIIDSGNDSFRMRSRIYTGSALRLDSPDTITIPIGDGRFRFDYVFDPATMTLTSRIFDDDEAGSALLGTASVTLPEGETLTLDAFGLTNGFNGSSVSSLNYTVFIDDVVYTVGTVAGSNWNVNANGNWSNAANWTGGVPNAPGAVANFGSVITAPRTVTLDAPMTVGVVNFDNANSYTISGSSTLTIDATSGNGAINVLSGSHSIAAPIQLADNTTVAVASGQTLSVQHVRGAGLTVGSGTMRVINNLAANSPAGTSRVATLAVGSGARLDLNNNSLIVNSGSLATVTASIKSALENGGNFDWLGPGIGSTQANVQNTTAGSFLYGLGVVLNDLAQVGGSGPIYTTFAGQTLTGNEILVKFTYFGDADLSGSIDATDYSLIDNGYVNSLSGWINGDFDYSGSIDATDYALIDNAYVNQAGPLAEALIAEHARMFGGEYLAALRAVQSGVIPEPASLGLLLGAAWSLRRSRRRA
ncbi:hypothetical protein [Fontivita pretiosa]|uniref:hypothetical protein n=1 Tax=Fontivita pretiosa TaxID=2989684 RepID=UPI003D16D4D8